MHLSRQKMNGHNGTLACLMYLVMLALLLDTKTGMVAFVARENNESMVGAPSDRNYRGRATMCKRVNWQRYCVLFVCLFVCLFTNCFVCCRSYRHFFVVFFLSSNCLFAFRIGNCFLFVVFFVCLLIV